MRNRRPASAGVSEMGGTWQVRTGPRGEPRCCKRLRPSRRHDSHRWVTSSLPGGVRWQLSVFIAAIGGKCAQPCQTSGSAELSAFLSDCSFVESRRSIRLPLGLVLLE